MIKCPGSSLRRPTDSPFLIHGRLTTGSSVLDIGTARAANVLIPVLLLSWLPLCLAQDQDNPESTWNIPDTVTQACIVACALQLLAALYWDRKVGADIYMCGGMTICGTLLLPFSWWHDLSFVWNVVGFYFRRVLTETCIPWGQRDIHPAGAKPTKTAMSWIYKAPRTDWRAEKISAKSLSNAGSREGSTLTIVAPAVSWLYYTDELGGESHDLSSRAAVAQFYVAAWTYVVGIASVLLASAVSYYVSRVYLQPSLPWWLTLWCTVCRTLAIVWRWTADFMMSNYYRGVRPVDRASSFGRIPTQTVREAMGDSDYATLKELWALDRLTGDGNLPHIMPVWIRNKSRQAMLLCCPLVLDWMATKFLVALDLDIPRSTMVVTVGSVVSTVHLPTHVMNSLEGGTRPPYAVELAGMVISASYAAALGYRVVAYWSDALSPLGWPWVRFLPSWVPGPMLGCTIYLWCVAVSDSGYHPVGPRMW